MRSYRPAQSTGSLGTSDSDSLKRATYYLRPEQIKALKLKAVMGERNLSEVVREAVDRYLREPDSSKRRGTSQSQDEDILFCG
jgi:hypothetical protein